MTTGLIGPAISWQSLTAHYTELEATDVVSFNIIGVRLNGSEELLFTDATKEQDLGSLNASEFPYLKVVFKASDNINLTAAQLNNWIVIYTPAPDGLLIFKGPIAQQVFNEGQKWQGPYGFINITNQTFSDSLTVHAEVYNQASRTSQLNKLKIKAPLPGDTTTFYVDVNTINKAGLNDVNVYVNPKVTPEQYYDNNVLQLRDYLRVDVETIRPVLDVSIDGRYIENRDFVTSNPFILIKVWDENKNILKTDTTGMEVYVSYPCDSEPCGPTPISLSSQEIKWYPATATTPFRIEFHPPNLSDGVYTLRVEATDSRANSSGSEPYEVQFTVANETSVTIKDPFPNPFTNDVYFKIVITGNELPDAFDMKLTDVNGKILGHYGNYSDPAFHIGTNELSWNGTDPGGNLLPSGVYIYKMMLYIQDRYVEKIGKLVLVRTH